MNKKKEVSKMKKFRFLPVITIIIMWLGALLTAYAQEKINPKPSKKSASKSKKMHEPYSIKKDPFYRIARLIMIKEEINIYKHLPDHESRLKFIDEFWKKRDPTPGTDENESKEEFILRIAFANKYFREASKGGGWNTERGRILLQLGFPDQRYFSDSPPTYQGRLLGTRSIRKEYWRYDRYQMTLLFDDRVSRDKLSLYRVPNNFSYALERAKFSLNLAQKSNTKKNFKFDAKYNKSGQIEVAIPVEKVSFEEKENRMIADFGVEVYVYRNNVKIDEINMPKTFSVEKDKLLNMKTIEFSVPYSASEKGKYYFDVVIKEKSSEAKFRDFVKCKI
jgi:GWxTD domain-containing protein